MIVLTKRVHKEGQKSQSTGSCTRRFGAAWAMKARES